MCVSMVVAESLLARTFGTYLSGRARDQLIGRNSAFMIITAGLAIVATAFLNLSQIASMGAFLYLAMDIAILILITILRVQNQILAVIVAASVAAAIVLGV